MTNKTSHIQSVVGQGRTDMGLLEVSQNQPRKVIFDGATYLVGAKTEEFSNNVIERMDINRLGDSVPGRALTYATLGNLLGEGSHTIKMMMGFPVQLMTATAKVLPIIDELRAWLIGTHSFSFAGVETTVTIEAVNFISQPKAAFVAYAYNDAGEITLTPEQQRATTGICDVGFNTVDLQVIKPNGRIDPKTTDGDDLGMRRAAEALQKSVFQMHGKAMSLHEADELLRAKESVVFIETLTGFHDVTPLVAQAKAQCADGVVQFLGNTWEKLSASVVLFAGGGAEALKTELLNQFPTGRVMPDPVMSIALGLGRWGRHVFGPSGLVVGLDPGFGGFKGVLL